MIFKSKKRRRSSKKKKEAFVETTEEEETKSASNPWISSLFLIAGALLVVSVFLYIRYQSLFISCIGIYFWLIGGGVVCGLRLLQLTHYILPDDNRELAHELLSNSFLSDRPKKGTFPHTLAPSFQTLGVGLIPSDQILLITKYKNPIPEILGPGFVQIPKGYSPKQLLSLIPQRISKKISLTTADGHFLESIIDIEFQIKSASQTAPNQSALNQHPYSYDEKSVLQLLYSSSKGVQGENISWNERIMRPLQSALLIEVRKYRLDQLIGLSDSNKIHFQQIEKKLKTGFQHLYRPIFSYSDVTKCPIQLNELHLHPFYPGEEVDRQRIRQWQSQLIQEINLLPEPEQLATKQQTQTAIFDHTLHKIEQDTIRFPERILELVVFHLAKDVNRLLADKEIQSILPVSWLGLWHKIHDLIYPPSTNILEKNNLS